MGCFWSSEDREKCHSCPRTAVNGLIIIDHQCECCRSRQAQLEQARTSVRNRPCFGEYRCECGRFWPSRLSWPGKYQICKRCSKHVFPHKQRALRESDMTGVNENREEHQKELCQMCQQLGEYCGSYRKGFASNSSVKVIRPGPKRDSKHTTKTSYGRKKY